MSKTPIWNDDWREELKENNPDAYERLSNAKNIKKDITEIAKLMYKYNLSGTKEDSLDRAIEWITDWNNQANLCLDDEEFKKILEII